ncbi:unnamed protein product [Caenorhabditis sp. 36 PRJEB53466]|nr:unnamed protein product [Caenorhabditis sp. 36 PRJEB53466]
MSSVHLFARVSARKMATEFQQQLAAGGLCNAESIKAFNQMYNTPGFYDKNIQQTYPMFPFMPHFATYPTTGTSSFSPSASSTSSTSSTTNPSKKKPVPVPEKDKDNTYYERRRRNNEAARKSREQRRKQDLDNEVKVRHLMDENAKLLAFVHQLTMENNNMKYQLAQQSMQLSQVNSVDQTHVNIPTF